MQKYAPPNYQISIDVIYTRRKDDRGSDYDDETAPREIYQRQTFKFSYNWDTKRMYVEDDMGWRYINPKGSSAETGLVMNTGEMAFYLAYHMKFYDCLDDVFYDCF